MSAAPELEPIATGGEGASPFLQLHFYRQEDQDRFAGRDDEINAVVTGVLSFDTFVLYGRSGLGKTSLLLAGVFPQLAQRGMTPVYTRVLDLPVSELRKKLEADIEALPGTVVLILDQFEEFFIRIREQNDDHPSRRMEACREMSAMLQDVRRRFGSRLRLLFGIREDYFAELEDFRAELPAIAAHGFRLLPLTAYGARRAIILMLERSHPPVVYEQTLVNTLLDEIGRTGFDPLLLQIICSEVWREAQAKRAGTNELRAEDLESVGGFEQIFQRYVERAAKATIDPLLVRVLLDTLITADQTKRVVRASDLLRDGAATRLYVRASKDEVDELLSQLVELQLVRPVGESRERFELLHDRLVPVVKKWLEGDKTFVDFRFAKKFIDSMAADGQFRTNIGRLISDEQMTQIVERYALRLQLTPDQTELVFRSSVHNGDRDAVMFWASRLDEISEHRAIETVGEMLETTDPRVRAGAARAVCVLPSGRVFVPKLLDMVVNDFAEVRETAAKSFAALASDEDLARVGPYTIDRRAYERVTAIAVECYDQMRPANVFPLGMRLRAWRAVRKRSAAERGEWIRDAMVNGAIRGTIIGGIWALTIAFAMWIVFRWNIDPGSVVSGGVLNRIGEALILGVCGAAAGALMGWSASRREARREWVEKWEPFYGGPTRGITQALVMAALSASVWRAFSLPTLEKPVALWGLMGMAAVTFTLMWIVLRSRRKDPGVVASIWLRLHRAWPWMALFVLVVAAFILSIADLSSWHIVQILAVAFLSIPVATRALRLRNVCAGESTMAILFWTVVSTGGIVLIGTMGILWFVERVNDDVLVSSAIAAVALGLGCFRAAVLGLALGPLVEPPPHLPRVKILTRTATLACVVLSLWGYVALFGLNSIPAFAEKRLVGRDHVSGRHLAVLPNTHYFRMVGVSDERRFVTITTSMASRITTSVEYVNYLDDPTAIFFLTGPFLVGVSSQQALPEYQMSVHAYPLRVEEISGNRLFVAEVVRVAGTNHPEYENSENYVPIFPPFVLWDRASARTWSSRGDRHQLEQSDGPLVRIGGTNEPDTVNSKVSREWPFDFEGSKLTLVAVRAMD